MVVSSCNTFFSVTAGDVDADGNEVANNDEEHKKSTHKKVSVDPNHTQRLNLLVSSKTCCRDCEGDAKCPWDILNLIAAIGLQNVCFVNDCFH